MRVGRLIAVLALSFLMVACNSEQPDVMEVSDAPRFPNDEGVVSSINAAEIELDGKRRYPIDPEVQSFKTFRGHEVTPLAHWEKRYVQVGLRDDKVIWVSGIGIVLPGPPPEVFYPGVFKGLQKDRMVFEDGTTLGFDESVKAPTVGMKVEVSLDPKTHKVVKWKQSGAPPSA